MKYSEKHTFGDHTTKTIIKSGHVDQRQWLTDVPICTTLEKFQIHHLGEITANTPYTVVREHQEGTFFLSCLEGKGEILINGQWVEIHQNQACLLPPFRLNALRAIQGTPWKFHYVRYFQGKEQKPPITCQQPVIDTFDSRVFASAMRGMINEQLHLGRAKFLTQWAQLIQVYVEDFSEKWKVDNRLWSLWHQVSAMPQKQWTLDTMARAAFVSTEHLRRLTLETYGRSPIKHLTWIRLQRAAELLITTDDKVEVIGYEVGYSSPYVFSTAFKRFFSIPPSEYRFSNKIE